MTTAFAISPATQAKVRPLTDPDWAFVYTTWANTAAAIGPLLAEPRHARTVRQGWKSVSHPVLNAIRERASFAVACKADEPTILFGWAAVIDGEPLFVYVSRDFRQRGIGRALKRWQKEQCT